MNITALLRGMSPEPSKDVDSPLQGDWPSVVGLILIVVVGCVANTAGVGGGAIFVPLFQSLVGFGVKESTALSQALITAGSIVSVLLNLFTPSPVQPWRPLIDFSLVLLLLPVLLVGVSLGVLLSVILPSYVISVLLFLLMILLIIQSLGKGIHMWRLESKQKRLQHQQLDGRAPQPQAPTSKQLDLQVPGGGDSPDAGQSPDGAAAVDAELGLGSEDGSRGNAAGQCRPSAASGLRNSNAVSCSQNSNFEGSCRDSNLGSSFRSSNVHVGRDSSRRGRNSAGVAPGSRPDYTSSKYQSWRNFRPDATRSAGDSAWFNRRNAWLQRLVHGCNELGAEGQSVAGSWRPVANPSIWQQRQLLRQQEPAAAEPARPPMLGALKSLARMSMPHASALHAPLLSASDSAAARAPHGHRRLPQRCNWGHSEEELLAALDASRRPPKPPLKTDDVSGAVANDPKAEGITEPTRQPMPEGKDGGPDDGASGGSGDDAGWMAGVGSHVHSGWVRLPKVLVIMMLACWLTYMALQLGRTLSVRCSATYWGILAAQCLTMPAFSLAAAAWTQRQRARRRRKQLAARPGQAGEPLLGARSAPEPEEGAEPELGLEADDSDDEEQEEDMSSWSSFLTYQALALTAGILGGLLGLGGGMIIGPVLLELGVHPQVSSATSSAMVLFSSSTALVSLAALGGLNVQYAEVFSLASMLASVLGVVVIGCAIRSTGRVSLVVLTLAAVMLIGAVAVGIGGAATIVEAISSGTLGPLPFCPSS